MTNLRTARRQHRRTRDHRAERPLESFREWARATFKRAAPDALSPRLARIVHGSTP